MLFGKGPLEHRGPTLHRGVAQLAERWSPKPEVASSIPAAPADIFVVRRPDASRFARRRRRVFEAGQDDRLYGSDA